MSIVLLDDALGVWHPNSGCSHGTHPGGPPWLLPHGIPFIRTARSHRDTLAAAPAAWRRTLPRPAQDNYICRLPDEILLQIFQLTDLEDKLALWRVDRRISAVAHTPSLFANLHIASSGVECEALPHVHYYLLSPTRPARRGLPIQAIRRLMPLVTSLTIDRRGTAPAPEALYTALAHAPPTLEALEYDGAWHADPRADAALREALARVGPTIRQLAVRRYRQASGTGLMPWCQPGPEQRWEQLEHMELHDAYAAPRQPVSSLVLGQRIRTLDLGFCALFALDSVGALLSAVPPTLERLSLRGWPIRADTLVSALARIPVVAREEGQGPTARGDGEGDNNDGADDSHPAPARLRPTALRQIDLRDIDTLTRSDIRQLKAHWLDVRRRAVGRRVPALPARSEEWCIAQTGRIGAALPPSPPPSPLSGRARPIDVPVRAIARAGTRGAVPPSTPPLDSPLDTPGGPSTWGGPGHDPGAICADADDADLDIEVLHSALLEADTVAGYAQLIELYRTAPVAR